MSPSNKCNCWGLTSNPSLERTRSAPVARYAARQSCRAALSPSPKVGPARVLVLDRSSRGTEYRAPTRWLLGVRGSCLAVLIALALPLGGAAETIYAVAAAGGWQVFWFDSEMPGEVQGSLPIFGGFDDYLGVRLEFDPHTGALYGFGYPACPITCPASPVHPARIDLLTGETSLLDWPGFPSSEISLHDLRIDPASREVRMVGNELESLRYSLNEFQLHRDGLLDEPGRYIGLAHTPPARGEGTQTFAVFYPFPLEDPLVPHLARIGDSGQVTVIGPIDVPHYVEGFDISAGGTAYLLAEPPGLAGQRLYRLNLETLTTEDLGEIGMPIGGSYVHGIAAAPTGLTAGALEIPTLSYSGLAALSLLLAGAALRRRWPNES